MIDSPINHHSSATDFRLLLLEKILLESEDFELAKIASNQSHQEWEKYLNVLAVSGLQRWLSERITVPIRQIINQNHDAAYLEVGDFKFCSIATENLLNELVYLPKYTINNRDNLAHFYVMLEVLEEEEEVIIRGFLRYDQLVTYLQKINFKSFNSDYYELPLSLLNTEPNHLVFYTKFVDAKAIISAMESANQSVAEKIATSNLLQPLQQTTTQLSAWFKGVFDESWDALESLINPESLAWNTRNVNTGIRRAKVIDLGIQLSNQAVALLINIAEDVQDKEKMSVLVQLHPASGEKYLPANVNLVMLSQTEKVLQETQSRELDNYIQLKPFKGTAGKHFTIEVSLGDARIRENFQL